MWCPTCTEDVEVEYSDAAAMTCCINCGRVLEDAAFASDVTFMKGADGEGELVGQFVAEDGNVRGLQRMAGGKVWSSRVSGGCRGGVNQTGDVWVRRAIVLFGGRAWFSRASKCVCGGGGGKRVASKAGE